MRMDFVEVCGWNIIATMKFSSLKGWFAKAEVSVFKILLDYRS